MTIAAEQFCGCGLHPFLKKPNASWYDGMAVWQYNDRTLTEIIDIPGALQSRHDCSWNYGELYETSDVWCAWPSRPSLRSHFRVQSCVQYIIPPSSRKREASLWAEWLLPKDYMWGHVSFQPHLFLEFSGFITSQVRITSGTLTVVLFSSTLGINCLFFCQFLIYVCKRSCWPAFLRNWPHQESVSAWKHMQLWTNHKYNGRS